MICPSIDIQGSILSADLLGKIRSEQALYQQGKEFSPELNNAKLKDDISYAWQEAKGQWQIFQSKLARLKENHTGTTETRNFWVIPLLTNLGYNLNYSARSEELNSKLFPISYRDSALEGFPVHICSFMESLDKRPQNRQMRVSPHAMLQEYLNYSEHLYGIVTNGKQLRLLRNASRITRLCYVEFNLEKMMEEDLYSDFVILYRLLHASRMPRNIGSGADSYIEKYHQQGLEAGSTIRDNLGAAVKESILSLANGFINHPDNNSFRNSVNNGEVNLNSLYRHLLRIIYRLLFLFVIEERNLVYAESKSPETKRFNQIYFKYYSLLRLRKLAKRLPPQESQRHYDLWQGLLNTFALFEDQSIGGKMGIMSLEGDLFSYEALSSNVYDLHLCKLSNAVLLKILKSLTYFENENKVLSSVNYGGLDVEEFGSVYEGLLELKLNIVPVEGTDQFKCSFDTSNERSKSGSHYTPEELVQPLIKHSLEYLIEERIKEPHTFLNDSEVNGLPLKEQKIKALLNLKVCDVACGSGHILLNAARRIALEIARIKTDEEQPNPNAVRVAIRDVIRQCIYGVDKNELAVELCKIAFWLEAHNPGEPLSFLDHHIKCGDSIVGLVKKDELENGIAEAAFKTLPGDDKITAKAYRDKNIKERKAVNQTTLVFSEEVISEIKTLAEKYNWLKNLPENNPQEVAAKEKEYKNIESSVEHQRLKQIADLQIAQFFIPKTEGTNKYLMTDEEYRNYLNSINNMLAVIPGVKAAYAVTIAAEKHFFHWFLEFPEVMQEGGFDCILGNPPFLGGQRLSGAFGDDFLNYVKNEYAPAGSCDLVTYFFRRIYELLKPKGFQSLISTNTIAQGSAREGGLDVILSQNGSINFAIRSIKWPGLAAVEVSLVTIYKGIWGNGRILGDKKVDYISSYLDDAEEIGNPYQLKQNEGKSFQGSIVLGKGFILEPGEAEALIAKNPKNKDVLFPYLNGEDLNTNPDQSPSRWVINFFNWDEDFCRQNYPDCFEIVERLVKPERIRQDDFGNFVLRKPLPEKWWIYAEKRPALYQSISGLERVLVINNHTKYHQFAFINTNIVYSHALTIISSDKIVLYTIMCSNIGNGWAWKYGSTMGAGTLRYTPSEIFETYPFPSDKLLENEADLEGIGNDYHTFRKLLMVKLQLGLTKTYNLFHCRDFVEGLSKEEAESSKDKNIQFLLKHLAKTPGAISFEEALAGIIKLRELHKKMDETVLRAYGWTDINIAHSFYEVDYLPENDCIRYTISPETRKEVLHRLLLLNHKIYDEEVKAGLWDKKKTTGKKKAAKIDEIQGDLFK